MSSSVSFRFEGKVVSVRCPSIFALAIGFFRGLLTPRLRNLPEVWSDISLFHQASVNSQNREPRSPLMARCGCGLGTLHRAVPCIGQPSQQKCIGPHETAPAATSNNCAVHSRQQAPWKQATPAPSSSLSCSSHSVITLEAAYREAREAVADAPVKNVDERG